MYCAEQHSQPPFAATFIKKLVNKLDGLILICLLRLVKINCVLILRVIQCEIHNTLVGESNINGRDV